MNEKVGFVSHNITIVAIDVYFKTKLLPTA